MANSVGTVSIDLEARIAKFESDLGRAARVAEQRSNEMRKALGSIAAALGAGISVAGISAFVKHAIDAQDAISKLSQKVAVSTETLSGWQLAAKQAGGTNEGLEKGLIKLAQSAALAADGSKLQTSAFKAIGVSATDASGHLKPMEALVSQVADGFAKATDSTEKTVVATRLFGKAGAEMIPLLNAGSEGLREYTKMADDFGLTVGSKSAKAAERFNDSLEQLKFVGEGVANQIATKLAPALADLAERAVNFFRGADWKATLDKIATGTQWVVDNVGKLIGALKLLGEVLVTVYAAKAIRLGLEWIVNLAAQTTAVKGLIVAQSDWGAATAGSFAIAYKNIGALGIALNTVGAAVAGWQIGKYLSDQFVEVRLAGIAFVDGMLVLWERMKEGAKLAFVAVTMAAIGSFADIRAALADMLGSLGGVLSKLPDSMAKSVGAAWIGLSAGLRSAGTEATAYAQAAVKIRAESERNIAAIHRTTGEMADYAISQDGAKKKTVEHTAAAIQNGRALTIIGAQAEAAAEKLRKFNEAQASLSLKANDAAAAYNAKNVDPVTKAWNDYAAAVRAVAEAEGERIQQAIDAKKAGLAGVDVAKIEADARRETAAAIESMVPARERNIAAAEKELDVGGRMVKDMQDQTRMYGMSERAAFIARAGIAAETELRQKNASATQDQIDATKAQVEAMAAMQYDTQKFVDFQKQVAQEYQGFWENAVGSVARQFGDRLTGQTKKWSDFGRGLKSIAQQFVSDIIAQFVRLRILGPLMAGAMGTVAGWLGMGMMGDGGMLQQSANYYGSGSTIGGAAGATGGAGGGAGSYAGFLQNGVGAYKAYQWASTGGIWGSPAGAGASTAGTGVYGVNMPGGSVVYGNGAISAPYSPFGGTAGIGGYAVPYASIGGGLLGAYYGSQRGGGGFSTVASTVSYGALGAGIAGTAAGVAGGASLGAAAGGAFGAAAGMSWIPVVGWVLAAMALVDMVSGGKLFGTKYKTAASDATLRIGAEGGEASASLYQTKQRALFGGRKTRVVQQDVPPELAAAADALYNSVEKVMVQGAQKLGVDVPAMIEASLNTHTTYNDKGQVRATEYVVDYLGRTWKEATAEAAASRIGAEALVATVAASAGAVAQTIAEQWRDSAETLLDGAQTMLAAQIDINRGNSLIALGATATLSQIIKFVQSMQADGEKLADTYARIAQASAAYVQFVAQFAPQATGFGASLQAINKQMLANIDQANQLAQAAGMQHAAESDLANIHRVAAEQAAAAITQLSAAAQDLASKLYGAVSNTLSSVTAQIDKLTAKTQAAAQLAIGDKSPLDDKAKLDIALKGLRSGITSADDVLALGRKLYASSADYTGLYNKVSEILQLPGATGAQGIDGALTDYNKLIGQRDQLQAQADAMARFNDAKTLAQYVADISTTHGIGYNEAASGLGFSLADLGKDLGITNIAGYLDTLQQQDIAGTTLTASSSIVDAIRQLGHDLIATITGAPIVQPGPTGATSVVQSTPEQLALLQKLSGQLDELIANTADTAQSNQKMAKDGTSDVLRNISAMSRGATA